MPDHIDSVIMPWMHYIFWVIIALLCLAAILLLKSVLLPFVVGTAVAYILNPAVNRFGQIGIPRAPASLMILSGFMILIIALIAVISPTLINETKAFINDIPEYTAQVMEALKPLTGLLAKYTQGVERADLEDLLISNSQNATSLAKMVASRLAAGGQTVFDIISFVFFMPIVAYFMMKEWPGITRWIEDLIPRHAKDDVMELLKKINNKLSGFIRGQLSVALVLGAAYAIALTIAGLKYGLLIGLMSGLISIIPMVGSTIGLLVSIGVAWLQAGEWTYVLLVAAIFISGQLIEGNFLTPKLVGDSVGLHPLWVFFALLAGGSLLGVLGMFLAVPVTAIIGVLISFALHKYKRSAYYKGSSESKTKDKTKEINQETE
ncbi:MAG: AI-2E family transporter [Alphaproteobacteria bacterium]